MSKSKGNVIDPLDLMDEYGTDAFRFSLAAFAAMGRDVRLSEDRIAGYRNFANKVWNASRFTLMNLEDYRRSAGFQPVDDQPLTTVEAWILSRLQQVSQRGGGPPGRLRVRPGGQRPLPVHLARVLRLVPGTHQAPALR